MGIHIEDLSSFGRGELYKLILADHTFFDSFCPDNRKPILETIESIGYFIESLSSHSFLILAKSAVVCSNNINDSAVEVLHDLNFGFRVRA